jgi:hypothetical protein
MISENASNFIEFHITDAKGDDPCRAAGEVFLAE